MNSLPPQPTSNVSLFIHDYGLSTGSSQIADDTKYTLVTDSFAVHMSDPLAHLAVHQRLDWLLTHGCKNYVIHTNDEVLRLLSVEKEAAAKKKRDQEQSKKDLEFKQRVESWEVETYFIQWKSHMLWRTSSSEKEFNARIAKGKVHHFEFTEYDNGCTEPYMRCFYVCDNDANVYAFDCPCNPWMYKRNKAWVEGTAYPAFTASAEANQYQLRFRRKW